MDVAEIEHPRDIALELTRPKAACSWCQPEHASNSKMNHGICPPCFEKVTGRKPTFAVAAEVGQP